MGKIKQSIFLVVLTCNIIFAQYDYSPGFDAGKPAEMNKLLFMEGSWDVDLYYTQEKKSEKPKWIKYSQTKSEIESLYEGSFLVENAVGFPIEPAHEGLTSWSYKNYFSYDRYNEYYRLVFFDNIFALADIYEGEFIEENRLVVSNVNTATYNNLGDNAVKQRVSVEYKIISKDEFEMIWRSVDESKIRSRKFEDIDWEYSIRGVYKRK